MTETSGDPFNSTGGLDPSQMPPFRGSQTAAQVLSAMPKIWIGYLLSAASFLGETIAVSRNPELFKTSGLFVPPLEMFLPVFITRVYWFVCIYRIHKVLAAIPGYVHPVSPAKAVGFHFIPIFQIYWVFHWPMAIAKFVNARFQRQLVRGWIVGLGILFALVWSLAEPVTGSVMLFALAAYLAALLKRAITIDPLRQRPQI